LHLSAISRPNPEARSKVKRLLRIALAVTAFAFAVAPSHAQQLDPVKGPMYLQAQGPFYEGIKGKSTYLYSIKSDFARVQWFTYTDGETLKGKSDWTTAAAADAAPAPSDTNAPQPTLAAVWDLIYGPGFYASKVAGKKVLQGTYTGDKGTTLQVQSLDNFVAVGIDNHGNSFKIAW
jgi:hypothetical protein